jgi:ATP-dependent helicase HrpA
MAASLVETHRVYARMVAQVQPSWIEAAAGHLVRRNYTDAEWSPQRAWCSHARPCPCTGECCTRSHDRLRAGRSCNGASDLRRGGSCAIAEDRPGISARNAATIAAIEKLEAKLRRRDLLVGEAAIAEFYLERIPPEVSDVRGFNRWWHQRRGAEPRLLDLPHERLLARPLPPFAAADFPDRMDVGGNALELRYVFDPLAEDDGVTLVLPQPLLSDCSRGDSSDWCRASS